MRNSMRIWLGVFVLFLAYFVYGLQSAEPPKKSKGIFSSLKVGQNVSLKNEGSAYSIDYFDNDMLQGHKVVAVADDYVVIRDINDLIETTVPVYSVKAISKMKLK